MSPRASPPDLQELRDRVTLIWNYLRPLLEDDPLSPLDREAQARFAASMDEVVVRVASGKSLRQLRSVLGDLKEMATALRPKQIRELESLLEERFGPKATLDDHDAARRERIVRRDRIRTADEYRLIAARVEAIYDDPKHHEELEALNRLLGEAAARPGRLPGD